MKENGIDKPSGIPPEKREEKALFGKNNNDAITEINKQSFLWHYWFKVLITIILVSMLICDLCFLHSYCMEVFSKGLVNHDNTSLLEIIFTSNFFAIVGLTTGIVTLAARQPFLPLESNEKIKTSKKAK